ncbi:peptide synthase [Gordonia sp. TBRC 11910]|uniref:Peptide synthase n=1 Tax=Gordonia asplenii TaxID=2725283 RepID=A0A848KW75_9ACTN|nr:condensation domain-containing protein [Gordonia asplenii]NMO01125.1 peptide synthase [Gordonia asplenii]
MEYTELSDYPLPSGRVTEWTVLTPDDAWAADERRLSLTHLAHARRAVAAGDNWHSEWIGTAFHIEHPLDAVVLARTMERWYARHEVFRSTLTPGSDADGEFTRRTVASERVTASNRLVGRHLSSTAVYEHITEHFDTTVSPLRWPHCIAVTVEPLDDPDSFLFVFAADHTVMDAYTQVFAIDEVVALYESELTGTPDDLPEFGSYVDFSEAERRRCERTDAADPAVAAWSAFFDAHAETAAAQPDRMPAFPMPSSGATGPVLGDDTSSSSHQASLSSWILDAEQTERFHRVCKAAGANMQAGVYTALTIAARRHCGDPHLRLINPVHTRSGVEWLGSAGWFVDIVPVHLRPGAAETFLEAIGTVAANVDSGRNDSPTPYSAVADVLDDPATDVAPQFVVSYIDMRTAAGAQHWARRKARVLRSATAQADEVYLWINRVPGGTNISARFPSGAAGNPMSDFITSFTGVLREVAATGDAAYSSAPRPTTEAVR